MYSTLLASSLFAALVASAPVSNGQSQVNLQIGISTSGDDSTTRLVPFGTLSAGIVPPASRLVVSGGVNAPISDDKIICQAFSDTVGNQKLGVPFDETLPGISVGDGINLATVGSVFCSDAAGAAAFLPKTSAPSVSKVTIQLEFDNEEGAVQRDVPVNGQKTANAGDFNSGFILPIDGKQPTDVSCDAFTTGQKKVGTIKGDGTSTVLAGHGKDIPIVAFTCKSSA